MITVLLAVTILRERFGVIQAVGLGFAAVAVVIFRNRSVYGPSSAVVLVCHDHNPRVGNCRAAAETLDEFHLRGVHR